jgi:hypothetical protein
MDDLHRVNDELPVEHDAVPLPTDLVTKASTCRTSASSAAEQVSPVEAAPYTIDDAITDAIEQITGDPLPDPFTGDHTIEYWIWTGSRLVPATPEAAERIRQQEMLEDEEFRARHELQRLYRIRRRQAFRRIIGRLAVPLLQAVATFCSSTQTGKRRNGQKEQTR